MTSYELIGRSIDGISIRSVLSVCVLTLLLSFYGVRAQTTSAQPNPQPDSRFKAEVLLIVAHPDDETALGSYLAKLIFDEHKQVAIIYTNRGGGGGNSAGNEQSTAMGAIREIEARQATAVFGIHNVWFLNGQDTPGQDVFRSLQSWGHGATLEQIIRLVRLTRPDVIVTWLPHFVAGENHGDHQAAGVIATEAFDVAGDPTVYPAQVATPRERTDIGNATEGLVPWQTKKIYYFSDASHPLAADGPAFDIAGISPSRKLPYYRLAADLHTYHRTQGDVAQVALDAIKSGDFKAFKKWLGGFRLIFGKSVVQCDPSGDLFEGINGSRAEFKRSAGYRALTHQGISLELGGPFAFYRDFWRAHDIEHLAAIVGPEIEIATKSYFHVPLLLRNDTPDSVDVDLKPELPPGWKEASGTARYRLAPGEVYPAQAFMTAPEEVSDHMSDVRWVASVKGKVTGVVSISVKVSEWTLPQ